MDFDCQNLMVKGFETTEDQMRDLKKELDWVTELAPSDSNVELIITKSRNFFRGIFTIKSAVKCFQTVVLENTFDQVIIKSFMQIHSDLKKWKKERFDLETNPAVA